MLFLRIGLGILLGYVLVVLVAWRFQERLAFPAPRARVPDPRRLGIPRGERIELTMPEGTRLVGWYLPPSSPAPPHRETDEDGQRRTKTDDAGKPSTAPGLLWFYGNGENIAGLWPVLRDFQPPGVALLVVDYPGYGESEGRATEPALYEAADVAYDALASRAEVDPGRIYVYGRSLGSAVATYTATRRPVAGLILESPFTSARAMARRHYAILPPFILRLGLDNLARIKRLRCPVLVFHGTADRLVPTAMGMTLAAAAPGPAELVLIQGSGHNDTYDVGDQAYREKLAAFVNGTR